MSVLSPHRVKVWLGSGGMWAGECSNKTNWFPSLDRAMTYAQDHAWSGEHEDRWCPDCQRYKPTCDDLCLECGSDT